MGVKKPNRAARMKRKAEHAETYEKGFTHGYAMGYEQAKKEMDKRPENGPDLQKRYNWF
jgi:flagellar biosynthesis/type III secretory pathway protein FliH